jgi:hypothetical protein
MWQDTCWDFGHAYGILEETLPQYSNPYNSKAYGTPIFFMDSKVF